MHTSDKRLAASTSINRPLFFFSRIADHRDLHSFPTRRSSDLELAALDSTQRQQLLADLPEHKRAEMTLLIAEAEPMIAGKLRSEEHTSELQSRRDLVCRLLLEKKKIRKAYGDAGHNWIRPGGV